MNPLSFVIQLLTRLPPALSATRRLVDAVKAPEPPPPVMTGEATEYLRGRNQEVHRQHMEMLQRKRIAELRARVDGEPEEPE